MKEKLDIVIIGPSGPGSFLHMDELCIIGKFDTLDEAVLHYGTLSPDIILFNNDHNELGEGNCAKIITGYYPAARLIFLAQASDERSIVSSIVGGASGYLSLTDGWQEIQRAIWKVYAGECIVSGAMSNLLFKGIRERYTQSPQHHKHNSPQESLIKPRWINN